MLTDAKCRNAQCPEDKARARFSDSGGLYLEVSSKGSKRWFLKFREDGKESRLAFGSYPAVSLADARKKRDAAKLKKAEGVNLRQERAKERLSAAVPTGSTFADVANEWFEDNKPKWVEGYAKRVRERLDSDLIALLGPRKLSDIEPLELSAVLRKITERGAVETAHRCLGYAVGIWAKGVRTERARLNIAQAIKGELPEHITEHRAAITDPADFAVLLRAIKAYRGGFIVRAALQLAPLLLLRPSELRGMAWAEVDLDAALLTIPAARMKRRKKDKANGEPHLVPLARQAVEILRELKPYTESTGLVFPNFGKRGRSISDNSVRTALISLGYDGQTHTWHGFRASARTMAAERLEINPLVIDAQLAHAVPDPNGRAYNRTTYIKQRAEMMQQWADYLDSLTTETKIIKMKRA